MRAVAMFSVPHGTSEYWEDRYIWQRMRELGLERGRLRAVFSDAAERGLSADDIRGRLVDDIGHLLNRIPLEDREDVEEEVVYSSVLPGTWRSTARNVPFFVTRPNGSDIRIRVFADELRVVLDASERLVGLLNADTDSGTGMPLVSDINVLEDGQNQTVVVGEQVGHGWRRRISWATKQSSTPAPVAAAAFALGAVVLTAASFVHIPPGLGTPLIAAGIVYTLGVTNAARKTSGIEWHLDYTPPKASSEADRLSKRRSGRPARKGIRGPRGADRARYMDAWRR